MSNESPLVSLLPQTRSCSIAQTRPARGVPAGCGVLPLLPLGPVGCPGLCSARAWPVEWETNGSTFWETGRGPVSRHLLKQDYKIWLGMPMRFSCTDPAGTAAVPSRDCRTSHRVEHSGCCKIRTVVTPEQICNVRERI